ncbi:MAG: helix-turn-helix domain containing protein [Eubacteriales bacterium]|nr:helix-turn-helix domain containing protein [Eubacteriales bacterium]
MMEKRSSRGKIDFIERSIYADICSYDGIKAKDIGKHITSDRHTINQYLYKSAFMRELCYRDDGYLWHGMIRQDRPHIGLGDFCGYYGYVKEFLQLSEEEWFAQMMDGCRRIGRNLNDTRGLFHSFRDCRQVMRDLFSDLSETGLSWKDDWEIAFELRINRARYIRIYADVLLITEDKVFSLEFKMKDKIEEEEVEQAAKYTEYLEVVFGPDYDVIPCLVLTRANDLYTYANLPKSTAEIPVASGDMLFNLLDEYLHFLQD